MAARIHRVELDAQWRRRIQTGVLLRRLEDHALGDVEMSPTQIRAAEVLLKKAIPDLTATEMTGQDGGPIELIARWQSAK